MLCKKASTSRSTSSARGSLRAVAISALLLVVEGWDMVAFSRMVNLLSNGYLAVPMWIPQLAVPVGAALLLLASIVGFAAAWRDKKGPSGEPHKPAGIE